MKVTVIMPVYNPGKYLSEAINSILNQTYTDFELLIIDDASTDHSKEAILQYADPRIRYVMNEINLGISGTRNRGIELSRSKYIAFMDHDDIALPTRLEKEVQYLEAHQEVDIVGGHVRTIDQNGRDLNQQWSVYLNPSYIKAYMLLSNTVAISTVLMRKEFLEQHRIRFKDNCYGAEDYRFWVECSLKGTIANLDETFLYWRTGHNNETSRVKENKLKEREEVIRDIQKYALQETGFSLTDEELSILLKVFKENGSVENRNELEAVYQVLKKIAMQAKVLHLENSDEIVTMCRKRFGEKVGKAFFLW